jgi:hypothetical protein
MVASGAMVWHAAQAAFSDPTYNGANNCRRGGVRDDRAGARCGSVWFGAVWFGAVWFRAAWLREPAATFGQPCHARPELNGPSLTSMS